MNPKQAQYISAVLRNGSFTAAAKELFISQPALSQTIRSIEKELGAPIFDRDSTPLQLTYAGKLYVDAMVRVTEIMKNMQNEVNMHQNELEGHLTLGLPRLYAQHVIPKAVSVFREKYPFVTISIRENLSGMLERAIIDGECDIVIMNADANLPQLEYHPLGTKRFYVIASQRAPLARSVPDGTPVTPEQIAREHFVISQVSGYTRDFLDRVFRQIGVMPAIDVESGSAETAFKIVEETDLISVVTANTIRIIQPEGLNVYPLSVEVSDNSHLYMVHRKNMFLTGYMKEFVGIVMRMIEQVES